MTHTYKVNAQGYGGGGPSVSPFVSTDLNVVKSEIEDLIASDHAVQLYLVKDDGTEERLDYEVYSTVNVVISPKFG